jgi:ADP-dependent NAD(P)H-hydrate dehydratase / NAD(P)H-hydrate epimerase
MKILDSQQIKTCDMATIQNEPITSIDLMERAAGQLNHWMVQHFQLDQHLIFLAGTGNNGGDALALARILFLSGYKNIQVYLLKISPTLSFDCAANYQSFATKAGHLIYELTEGSPMPEIHSDAVVVDGIFGSGLNRPIEGYWAQLIDYINQSHARVIAIDVPSGLYSWDNRTNYGAIIKACFTLCLHMPKLPFFFAENEVYVGQWYILPIGLDESFIESSVSDFYFIEKKDIAAKIKYRKCFSHKGTFGHAFLVAGSYQMIGAAVLSARSCLKTGVGLLTVYVPKSGNQIMQTAIPEAMLYIDEDESGFCEPEILEKYNAVGIGPGIGLKQGIRGTLRMLLQTVKVPMVLDADALNILTDTPDLWDILPENTILTPHPGEFDRLTHIHSGGYERMLSQIELSIRYKIIIVLKGAYTSISTPEGKVYFNSTGNPGMATAGSGDVLTGIILSLLAQGYQPLDAAIIGVYLHGLAGDIAKSMVGEESLIASDITDNLGKAFIEIKKQEI